MYPPKSKDILKVGYANETIKKKFHFESCNSDECMKAVVNIKGGISEEQIQMSIGFDDVYSQCELDKSKPEWRGPLVPRTLACYEAAVKYFYVRKITTDMAFTNVSTVFSFLLLLNVD